MTITLKRLEEQPDGSFYAVWHDEEDGLGGYDFGALHDSDGRCEAANFGIQAPRLSREQMAAAVAYEPPAHPAELLLAKLVANRPDLAERGEKAARLVMAGQVRLTGERTAVVSGDSDDYEVTGHADTCGCKWHTLRQEWCSHRLAVRMARALGQETRPLTEEEKEDRSEVRAWANKANQVARNARAHTAVLEFERRQRRKYSDGEGARAYMRMAQANGAATVPAHIYQRAIGK